jgi:transposase
LTVAAQQAEAKRLVAGGLSQRKAAKLLGVGKDTVGRAAARRAPKSGAKRAEALEANVA